MNEADETSMNLRLFPDNTDAQDSAADVVQEASPGTVTNVSTIDGLKRRPKVQSPVKRKRVERSFPAASFEEALELPRSIHEFAGAQKRIRRIRLFELLERSPDSGTSRQLVTNAGRYGLTTGGYSAEWLELTPEGEVAAGDTVSPREKARIQFQLGIDHISPFKALYEKFTGGRLPAKGIMVDFLREEGYREDEVSECVDTFLLNAKFVGILRSVSGAERFVSIDHVLDYIPAGVEEPTLQAQVPSLIEVDRRQPESPVPSDRGAANSINHDLNNQWQKVCFYITPIGSEGSEERRHSDLFLGSIIEPALEEFGLTVVRADRISEAGIITKQVIEHIIHSRLVIADLSYHNANVFYELALRHSTGKATVQVIRGSDSIPFDVAPMRTVVIDTSSIYTLVPQLDVYRAAIANQVRRALEHLEAADNPVTAYLPVVRLGQSPNASRELAS